MTIRIALLGLILIVPGLQAMDLEFKQEKHEAKKAPFTAEEREKPTTQSIGHAIKEGNKTEVARWLNQGISPNERDPLTAMALLNCCAMYNKPAIAEYLLTRNANINQQLPPFLVPPLMSSVAVRSTEMIKMLLQHKADVNAGSFVNNTALNMAVGQGNAPIMALLLSNGAKANTQKHDGDTPLITAARHTIISAREEHSPGYQECIKALLLAGADWTHKNKLGQTALDVAQKPAIKALLTEHRDLPAFLDDMVQTKMPPAIRNLRLIEQLQLRESGKFKSRKLAQSPADASEDAAQALSTLPLATSATPLVTMLESLPSASDEPAEALTHLPNTTSIKLKKLEHFSSGREMPHIKTYICES